MAGEPAVKELVKIGEHILKEEQSPEIWEESLTCTVFKGKGDAIECGNYRRIRLFGTWYENLGEGFERET